jgi:hypothetical protein
VTCLLWSALTGEKKLELVAINPCVVIGPLITSVSGTSIEVDTNKCYVGFTFSSPARLYIYLPVCCLQSMHPLSTSPFILVVTPKISYMKYVLNHLLHYVQYFFLQFN